ncbi:AAA family ATPase [Patescibacteria group bacterium]
MPTTEETLIQEIQELKTSVDQATIPPELVTKIEAMLARLTRSVKLGHYSEEYERMSHYINWITSLPWNKKTPDTLDTKKAKSVLDEHHYGLENIKERILEYISVLKLKTDRGQNAFARAPILLLVGLVGTGKTTFAKSLAESLGRQFARIPFGGMGSARDLRGQSRLHLEAEPGHVIKALRKVKAKNPVILLDEIDRISTNALESVMGVLVELLDPEQNSAFIDHYIDFPFDLSEVLFIATANNTGNIATAVMDRMEPISMPSYTDEQKIIIGKKYLLPRAIDESGLKTEDIEIEEALWSQITRPLGYDAGIRTMQRTIVSMVRKVAKRKVEGHQGKVVVNQENIKQFLPTYETELI